MNILSVNSFKFNTLFGNNNSQSSTLAMPRFGLTMPKPLSKDTVSFNGISPSKKMIKMNAGIPKRDAITAHLSATNVQPEITNYFKKLFEPITTSKTTPLNPVEDVRGRAKGILSIWEKANTKELDTLEKVYLNMTDLNGVKVVLRDGSDKSVGMALATLMAGITSGALILEEVEVKRPLSAKDLKKSEIAKYDYVAPYEMMKFVNEAKNISGKDVKYDLDTDYTCSNYTAVHFLFKFPSASRGFELQMMGHDVSLFKGMDDIFFKILDNKKVDQEFKPIEKLIKPLMRKQNDLYLEKFNKYRADSFLFQREKEPRTSTGEVAEFFLPLKYDIPYQKLISDKDYQFLAETYGIIGNPYDFNNIFKIYKVCREQNDKTREALEAMAKNPPPEE